MKLLDSRAALAWLVPMWVAASAAAQSIQPICSFPLGPAHPRANLVQGPDGNFYGTTSEGGSIIDGTVFEMTTNGVVTMLADFATNNGANPYAGLTLGADGSFYGTTFRGGRGGFGPGYGTVFKVTTNGALTTLVSFANTNGARPYAGLTLGPDGNLYGTTSGGGNSGYGTVFEVTTNGVLATLHSFTAIFTNGSGAYTNSDGASPYAGLTLGSDGNFYGTTLGGGNSGYGTVFEVTTNGVLTTLVSFASTNGEYPSAGLTLGPDGNFYGTTSGDSASSVYGTVFEVATNGALTTLVSFANTNGANPYAGLTLGAGGNFYGTTENGGNNNGYGTVFEVTTDGVLTTLVSFANTNGAYPYAGLTLGLNCNFYGTTGLTASGGYGTVFEVTTNGLLTTLVNFDSTNGADPYAGLTLGPEGNLYGTTSGGGSSGSGTVFKVTANGLLTTLHSFTATVYNGSGTYTNSDGATPNAGLTLGPDGNFYGTTVGGGSSGYGTVFKVTTNGVLTMLVSFADINGAGPSAAGPSVGLTLGPDGNFYGTTYQGGSSGYGTVFKVTTNGVLTTLVNFDTSNGAYPNAGLTLGSNSIFYGVTSGWAGNSDGTVFKVTTNGVLTTLVNFAYTNGALPFAGLTLGPDGNFYGTTEYGGPSEGGEIYRLNLPPTVLTGPTNLSVVAGDSAVFTVGLFGTAPFAYQWLSNGVPFASGTNSTLTVSNVGLMDAGNYQVIVTNAWGSITSSVAALTVLLPPAITNQPADETLPIGGTAHFAVSATGTSPLAYQWYFNNAAIAGASGSQFALGPVFTNEAGSYQVIVTNLYGSATSRVATLTVLLAPNPYGISGSVGGTITLYLASTPGSTNRLWATTNLSLPMTQWQVIATNIATNGFFQFSDTNVNEDPVKFYRLSTP